VSTPTDEVTTYHVVYDDGSVGLMQVPAGAPEPVLVKPGRIVSEAEYQAELAELQAATAQRQEEAQAAETALKKSAYDALVAGGFTPAVASTLSGYTPPPETEDGP
jgi:hypothetical protein